MAKAKSEATSEETPETLPAASEATPATHITVSYPTLDQGMDSVVHLGKAAAGLETFNRNNLLAHAWIAAGTGLGQAFPPDNLIGDVVATLPVADRQTLAAASNDLQAGKIDWAEYLKIALALLLKLLA